MTRPAIDPARFRRDVRRIANSYVNGDIDRTLCLARLRKAAVAAGITDGRRPTRAEKILDALELGAGDIEPGLLPKHLEPVVDAHRQGAITAHEFAAQAADLLRRVRTRAVG